MNSVFALCGVDAGGGHGVSHPLLLMLGAVLLAAAVVVFVMVRRGGRAGFVASLVVALAVLAGAGVAAGAGRAVAAPACRPVPSAVATSGSSSPTVSPTRSATSSPAPSPTGSHTSSAPPPAPATLSGCYTRAGSRAVQVSPPGTYPTPPISLGGSGWDLPHFVPDNGPVTGVAVTAVLAGPDGVLGTADDITLTTTTNNLGCFTFTTSSFGPYRVSITQLPTPDRQYSAVFMWPNNAIDFVVTPWRITTPKGAAYQGSLASGQAVTGLNFIATNQSAPNQVNCNPDIQPCG